MCKKLFGTTNIIFLILMLAAFSISGISVAETTAGDNQISELNITPDPIRLGAVAYIQYTLEQESKVFINVYKENGEHVKTIMNNVAKSAGLQNQSWEGKDKNGKPVPDGSYRFLVDARDYTGELIGQTEKIVLAGRTPGISLVNDTPDPFNPLIDEQATINYTLSSDAIVTVTILKGSTPIRTIVANELKSAGAYSAVWDGKEFDNVITGDGLYTYQIEAVSPQIPSFKSKYRSTLTVETRPPAISELTLTPNPLWLGIHKNLSIRYNLSEKAKVFITVYKEGNFVRSLVSGQYRYAGPNSAGWDLKDYLSSDVSEGTYTVVVGALDDYGRYGEKSTAVSVGYLAVSATSPAIDAKGVPVSDQIVIIFTETVRPGDTFKNITIKSGDINIPYSETRPVDNKLILQPSKELAYGALYTVTVPPGAVKNTFNQTLKNGYSFSFSTEDDPNKTNTSNVTDSNDKINLAKSVSISSTVEDGQYVTTATVDETTAVEAVNKGLSGSIVTIPVYNAADSIFCSLTGRLIKVAADKNAYMEIITTTGSIVFPASNIVIAELASQLGVNKADVKITINIARAKSEQAAAITAFARNNAINQVIPPVEFKAEAAAANKNVEIRSFTRYASYILYFPEAIDTVGANGTILNNDGTLFPAPTKITMRYGRIAAVIRGKRNGIYSVMASSKSFLDLKSHWAQNDISILASKLIITGIRTNYFAPEAKVTRAQFAAFVVRALGLSPKPETAAFKDTAVNDWYSGAVGAAADAGIIKGYANGTFRPYAYITREEAAVIAVNALKAAEVDIAVTENESNQFLNQFTDSGKISSWAKAEAALAVKNGIIKGSSANKFLPRSYCTRAESAVIIKKILMRADFI